MDTHEDLYKEAHQLLGQISYKSPPMNPELVLLNFGRAYELLHRAYQMLLHEKET